MVNATVLFFVVLAVKLARTEPGGRAVLKLLRVTVVKEKGAGVNRISKFLSERKYVKKIT
jgi:hypothetical protein